MDKVVDKIIPKLIHNSYTYLSYFYPQAKLMFQITKFGISTEKWLPNNNNPEFNKFKFILLFAFDGDKTELYFEFKFIASNLLNTVFFQKRINL